VPVTARLSQLFYDRLGEQVADELVGWFNTVDDTSRRDLRELNELNFARFDAKLEQRLAEFELKVEKRLAEFELKVEQRLAAMEQRMAAFEVRVERRLTEQTRWMVAMWAIQMVAIMGLWLRG